MKILISNDDGIESEGIIALAKVLSHRHDILVVAPKTNMTASSHSLSIHKPLKLEKVFINEKIQSYSLTGTPSDCVKFAICNFNGFDADLVVSGINDGENLGGDVVYSGTVSAALEAVGMGKKAIAVSCCARNAHKYNACANVLLKIVDKIDKLNFENTAWNLNIPNLDEIKGVKFTGLGIQVYSDYYKKISEDTYVLEGVPILHDKNHEDCDVEWVKKGYATMTPILFDKTNYTILGKMKEWL